MNAVVDEDLPRSFAVLLSQLGFTVFDIRDYNLRGSTDNEVYAFTQKNKGVLFSADLGFSNILHFPLGSHYGICILRFANEIRVAEINENVKALLTRLSREDYHGNLIILSSNKLRIRRHLQKLN